jgi:RNA polymerase sigma-70 factor (ECF subfamily)
LRNIIMTSEGLLGEAWVLATAPHKSKASAREDAEEALWVSRARAGDEAAYLWLLERYRSRVVRLAAHVLRRDSEAEDVAQEAFLRAFRGLSRFHGDRSFRTWLFRITVRLCLDRRRRLSWQREVSAEEIPEQSAPAAAADTRLLVSALLDQLTPPLRATLVLREIEGLEYEEIAQMLEVPVGTVRSRLHTARAQFRTLWVAADAEEEEHV